MNKGIIMDIKFDYAIIMNDKSCMEKITKKENMKVGQKIFYFDEDVVTKNNVIKFNPSMFIKAMGSIAALFFIVFTLFYQVGYKENAYAVVSLDINPSIQIEVDSDKNIIKVDGMNDDGKKLDIKDIKGLDINTGIKKIKQELVENKYLDENNDVLVGFALVGEEDDDVYENEVYGVIQDNFKSEKITYVKGKSADIDGAKTKGISLGRYEATTKSEKVIESAPVKEITELIKDKQNVIQWEDEEKVEEPFKVPGSKVVDDKQKVDKNKNEEKTEDEDTDVKEKPPILDEKDDTSIDNSQNDSINVDDSEEVPSSDDDVIIVEPDETIDDNSEGSEDDNTETEDDNTETEVKEELDDNTESNEINDETDKSDDEFNETDESENNDEELNDEDTSEDYDLTIEIETPQIN